MQVHQRRWKTWNVFRWTSGPFSLRGCVNWSITFYVPTYIPTFLRCCLHRVSKVVNSFLEQLFHNFPDAWYLVIDYLQFVIDNFVYSVLFWCAFCVICSFCHQLAQTFNLFPNCFTNISSHLKVTGQDFGFSLYNWHRRYFLISKIE